MNQLTETLESMKDQKLSGLTSFGDYGINKVSPVVDQAKCAIYDCNEPKAPGFPCCSKEHGWLLKTNREQIKKVQDNLDYKWQDLMIGIGHLSIAEVEYYLNFPYVTSN